MQKCKYLILLEIEKTGYIIGLTEELTEAKALMRRISKISNEYDIHEMYRVARLIHFYSSYEIKGNLDYCGKSIRIICNGVLSIHILKIDKTFSLGSFIKERQYSSWAIEPDNEADSDKYEEILEKFPHFSAYAN